MDSGFLKGWKIKKTFQEASEDEQRLVEGDVGRVAIVNHLLSLVSDLRQEFFDAFCGVELVTCGERIMFLSFVEPSREEAVKGVRDGSYNPYVIVPRIRREEDHRAVQFENAVNLSEHLFGVFEMFENPSENDDIEKAVLEGKALGVRHHLVFDRLVLSQRVSVRVCPVGVRRSVIHLFEEVRVTAADVEDACIPTHLLPDEPPIHNRAGIPFGAAFFVSLSPTLLSVH